MRPSTRPRLESRDFRSEVEPGSIPYSEVTQPVPRPRIQGGTDSSTIAVQIRRVEPIENRVEPDAEGMKSGASEIGRDG